MDTENMMAEQKLSYILNLPNGSELIYTGSFHRFRDGTGLRNGMKCVKVRNHRKKTGGHKHDTEYIYVSIQSLDNSESDVSLHYSELSDIVLEVIKKLGNGDDHNTTDH